jgi:hypothetical protein
VTRKIGFLAAVRAKRGTHSNEDRENNEVCSLDFCTRIINRIGNSDMRSAEGDGHGREAYLALNAQYCSQIQHSSLLIRFEESKSASESEFES